MKAEDAQAVLEGLRPRLPECRAFVGMQDSRAYMRVEDREEPDRWAAVYTPGQGYFSLQTETMLTWDYVDDDASDEEVHAALSRLVSLAVLYVLGEGEEMRSRRLGFPSLRLHDGNQQGRWGRVDGAPLARHPSAQARNLKTWQRYVPHYHLRKPGGGPGSGIGRHRPWQ